MLCVKEFLQRKIVQGIQEQAIGLYYGIQCDEVTDSSNWEQLGLLLRYVKGNKPVERLLEFIPCDCTTGEALCHNAIEALTGVGLDVKLCRSQTMDGAGNMSGKYSGFAAQLRKESPKATYHYCSRHDLNLALCKSCDVKEIHLMLDTVKHLGIFFHYSPKRSRRLEAAVNEINQQRDDVGRVSKVKFKIFCETRWVEKHNTIQDLSVIYEPLLVCLEAIGSLEPGWDSKSVTEAYGLLKRITDSQFIACLQTILHFFGYTKGLKTKLQGSALDVVEGYGMVELLKTVLSNSRRDEAEYDRVFARMVNMIELTGSSVVLEIPRRCGRQTQRNNVPAETPKVYYRLAVYLPFLDSLIQQLNMRFGDLSKQAVQGLCLIPSNISEQHPPSSLDLEYYMDDLPSPDSLEQELSLWACMWRSQADKPSSLAETLADRRACSLMYPNITKIIHLLLLTSVTASGVERANSSLKFIKNASRSTMGEDRFNALILMYEHYDFNRKLDIESIIDKYAKRHQRKMLLLNPLA